MRAAIVLPEPAGLLQHLFYFIAVVPTYAINAAIYFVATFILFYCTCNHSFTKAIKLFSVVSIGQAKYCQRNLKHKDLAIFTRSQHI